MSGTAVTTVITFENLQSISGYREVREVVAWLENNQVRYRRGKFGRPWTTLTALDKVLGLNDELDARAPRRITA